MIFERVDVCNLEGIGDDGAGNASSARSCGDMFFFSMGNEVPNDQEVI